MKLIRLATPLVLVGAVCVSHAGTLFGTDTASNLYSIDTVTANATLIGNHGFVLESLAYNGTTLYGASSSGNIYSLSTLTGAATFIGSTGLGNIEGLDFAGAVLFAFDFASQPTIYTINTSNGAATPFVQSNLVTGAVRTFAFTPDNSQALMATDSPTFQTMHSMNTSGVTTQIGSLGSDGVYGMDFVGNDLFGLGGNGQLWQFNPTTGGKTLIGSTGSQFWLGAAAAPVPEPATITAIGIGLAAFARRRRKSI